VRESGNGIGLHTILGFGTGGGSVTWGDGDVTGPGEKLLSPCGGGCPAAGSSLGPNAHRDAVAPPTTTAAIRIQRTALNARLGAPRWRPCDD
jgi:hypothetical protein